MQFKRFRRVFKKHLRRQQKQVETFSQSAEKGIDRNVFRRFKRLKPVRRFVLTWVALMVLLIGCSVAQLQHLSAYYQSPQPVPGGIYTEGIVGSISNVNPIYATSDVDRSLSRLLFAGLLTYDTNNELVGSLASKYVPSENGRLYTVSLKHGLVWQDGQPLTSADVKFTYDTIKDPDAQSPLFGAWQNIQIAAPDPHTVTFTLPSSLASFPYSLTTGILPQHILGKVSASNLRSNDFNTVSPVGAGPFMWHGLQVDGNSAADVEEQVALLPFAAYNRGAPKLDEFIMRTFMSQDKLREAFNSGQLSAAAGLDSVPTELPGATQTHNMLLTAGNYVFFKTTNGVLQSSNVRRALTLAAQPSDIIASLDYMTRPVTGPLLAGQMANDKKYAQKSGDLAGAKTVLAQDGWVAGKDGIVVKDGKPLRFGLTATDTPEFRSVTSQLRDQWKALGAKLDVQLISASDYATVLAGHEYDSTLYGISIGDDPDVFVYWDGSQADVRSSNRLNLSEWNNATANASLEAGRTRLNPTLRAIKYAPFLQAWQQDNPALGLYQPRYLYLTRGSLYGLTQHSIVNGINRFNDVQTWQVRTARVTQ